METRKYLPLHVSVRLICPAETCRKPQPPFRYLSVIRQLLIFHCVIFYLCYYFKLVRHNMSFSAFFPVRFKALELHRGSFCVLLASTRWRSKSAMQRFDK